MTMSAKIKIAVIVLLVSLSLAVIIQNTSPIEAKILFLSISIPLTVLIGGSLIVGYLLGLLTPVLWRRRQERSPEGPPAGEPGARQNPEQSLMIHAPVGRPVRTASSTGTRCRSYRFRVPSSGFRVPGSAWDFPVGKEWERPPRREPIRTTEGPPTVSLAHCVIRREEM